MLFEGTKNRKDSREIANEIEKHGGISMHIRLGTARRFYQDNQQKFDVALDILSDMVNPVFDAKIWKGEACCAERDNMVWAILSSSMDFV